METRYPMKAALATLVCLSALAQAPQAAFPIEDMDSRSLGLQYGLSFRGQNITSADVPSHETIHTLTLAYAPIPYVALEAGVGLDRLVVETNRSVAFQGEFGFSPNFGLILSSPYFAADMVRVTAGARALYLNSEDSHGFRYSGFISNPFLGAVVSPSGFFDIEAGLRAHFIDGTMQGPGGVEKPFSNQEAFRGYLGCTVKSPKERAFLTVDLDVSPGLDADWANGPREAQVGVSFGALLGWNTKSEAPRDSSKYFPDFSRMKERLKKMADEIE
ncbi:MAG: hypothetical protein JWO30_3560 [Fibrobacteres bacterium]|nr:hypothetical protein [Fibrobacterota bacterium]